MTSKEVKAIIIIVIVFLAVLGLAMRTDLAIFLTGSNAELNSTGE